MSEGTLRRYAQRQHWPTVQAIILAYKRRAELRALIRWATWKHLDGPRQAYQFYLTQEETRLAHYSLRFPRHRKLAHLLFLINCVVSPRPRCYPRGSAAHYRRRRPRSRGYRNA